jgi:hypothetical protein
MLQVGATGIKEEKEEKDIKGGNETVNLLRKSLSILIRPFYVLCNVGAVPMT